MLVIINVPSWMFIRPLAIPIAFTSISAVVFLLVLNFFRSPRRNFTGNEKNVVVSSVDGTVVALEEVYEGEFLHRRAIQLSVFMTVFNVHANWFPVNGTVEAVRHHNGRFLSAYLPKSSTENERFKHTHPHRQRSSYSCPPDSRGDCPPYSDLCLSRR